MTPEEIQLAIEAFQLLEPEVMKGVAFLIDKLHHKQLTAQDYLDLATKLVTAQQTPSPSA